MRPAVSIPQLGLWAVSLRNGKTYSKMTLYWLNNCLGCAVLKPLCLALMMEMNFLSLASTTCKAGFTLSRHKCAVQRT